VYYIIKWHFFIILQVFYFDIDTSGSEKREKVPLGSQKKYLHNLAIRWLINLMNADNIFRPTSRPIGK
jgi:hypothetical protein